MDFDRLRVYTYLIIISWSLLTFSKSYLEFRVQLLFLEICTFHSITVHQFDRMMNWIQLPSQLLQFTVNWNDSIFNIFFFYFVVFFSIATVFAMRSVLSRHFLIIIFWKLFGKWKWIVNLNWIPIVFCSLVCVFFLCLRIQPNARAQIKTHWSHIHSHSM